jgi:hypothetical protein
MSRALDSSTVATSRSPFTFSVEPVDVRSTIASAATIYRTIAQLKALGGEGILVTRIERLMP